MQTVALAICPYYGHIIKTCPKPSKIWTYKISSYVDGVDTSLKRVDILPKLRHVSCSCPAVAVKERMDGLELIMDYSQFN